MTKLLGARAVDRLAVRGARWEMESWARARPAGSCRPARGGGGGGGMSPPQGLASIIYSDDPGASRRLGPAVSVCGLDALGR